MKLIGTTRAFLLAAVFAACAAASLAQRGGPPGGGAMGGPPGGGGMGGMGGGIGMGMGRGDREGYPPPRPRLQLAPGGRWWDDKHTAKALGINRDQQKRMDDIFEANKGTLLNLYDNLQREEQHFNSLTRSELQDEAKVDDALQRVSAARNELEKARAHFQIQIRKELDPTQLAQLDKVMADGH